ncbi:hypothetical protein M8C21_000062, partial [Ambrosia artemisiifolia]
VKPVDAPHMAQGALPTSVDTPSAHDLGFEAGVYGALAMSTYVNGASTPVDSLLAAVVPGLTLATSSGLWKATDTNQVVHGAALNRPVGQHKPPTNLLD